MVACLRGSFDFLKLYKQIKLCGMLYKIVYIGEKDSLHSQNLIVKHRRDRKYM